MSTPKKLYKTTIVIWSEYDGADAELHDLAFQAEEGNAYCSKQESVLLTKKQIEEDPDWGEGPEDFFDDPDNDDPDEENENDNGSNREGW